MVFSDKNVPLDVTLATAIPATIADSTTYTSPILPLVYGNGYEGAQVGYGSVVVALKSTRVVTINIQRYLDAAGLIPVGAVVTQATTANVAAYAATSAIVPSLYFGVTVVNASGNSATITNVGVALLANAS